jgi:hypothetical protein
MKTPPRPKPTMSSVYGSDASARAVPNSAWTLGSTTATTYIALEPIVISASATHKRRQACGESTVAAVRHPSIVRKRPRRRRRGSASVIVRCGHGGHRRGRSI